MNDLLVMRLLLGVTVLVGFSIRYVAVLKHKTGLGDGRVGLVVLTAVLLYGGLLLASINKISYASLFVSAAALLAACSVLEAVLQRLARRASKDVSRDTALRYYG